MRKLLLTLACTVWLTVPASAATTPFAPVLLSPGEKLVLSTRVENSDWRPVVNGHTEPCFLVGFKILDLAGNVVAQSQQPMEVEPGRTVSFTLSHEELGIIDPCFLVGLIETVPIAQPVESNGKIQPGFSLQIADAAGVRIYAEKGLVKRKPQKLSQRLSFAPLLLAPGESVNLAAFNGLVEQAGFTEPCFRYSSPSPAWSAKASARRV